MNRPTVRPAPRSASSRRLTWAAHAANDGFMQRQRGSVAAAVHVLGVSLVLVQAALAGRTPLPQIAAGRSGTDAPTREALLVWKVGSPHRRDTPVPTAPPDIVESASTLGLSLDVRALPAREFARAFRAARLTNDEPDILVVDNMGLIWGITTPLGRFDGIGADAVVKVSETLKSFAPSGWEFLVPASRRHAAARTLATGPIQCELPVSVVTGGIRLALVAEGAVAAYIRQDELALDALAGGSFAANFLPLAQEQQSLVYTKVCDHWGNDRLVFAHVAVSFEGQAEIGQRRLLVVVGIVDGRPRLLAIGNSTQLVATLAEQGPTLRGDGPMRIAAPAILAPADGGSFLRFPPERRPDLQWTTPRAAVLTLLEWQFGHPSSVPRPLWSPSGFVLLPPSETSSGTVRLKAPFAIGRQPHRWRVWAVDQRGNAARSAWRRVNYLN